MDKPFFCVSYVPLLRGPAGVDMTEAKMDKDVLQAMKDAKNTADACMWIRYEDNPVPVMVMPNAKEVVDHIKYWSEGDPSGWFSLILGESEMGGQKGYTVALQPRVDKSIKRFIKALKMVSDIDVPDASKIQVLYKPLMLQSTGDTYFKLKDKLGKIMHLGIVDPSAVNMGDGSVDSEKVGILGPFEVLAPAEAFKPAQDAQA